MSKQKFPPGWDEKRVQELIAHYESETEDEEFADIEAAREAEDITLMAIPTELVPEVRKVRDEKRQTTGCSCPNRARSEALRAE